MTTVISQYYDFRYVYDIKKADVVQLNLVQFLITEIHGRLLPGVPAYCVDDCF